jgi:hypothetical protein
MGLTYKPRAFRSGKVSEKHFELLSWSVSAIAKNDGS